MMRRSAGFDANEAWRQLLKEWQNVTALELTANDDITCRINSVDLKNRLSDIETDGRDRLHVWLLRIVGALTAPTSMALPCRWRSRPQHQKRTRAPQQNRCFIRSPRRRWPIGQARLSARHKLCYRGCSAADRSAGCRERACVPRSLGSSCSRSTRTGRRYLFGRGRQSGSGCFLQWHRRTDSRGPYLVHRVIVGWPHTSRRRPRRIHIAKDDRQAVFATAYDDNLRIRGLRKLQRRLDATPTQVGLRDALADGLLKIAYAFCLDLLAFRLSFFAFDAKLIFLRNVVLFGFAIDGVDDGRGQLNASHKYVVEDEGVTHRYAVRLFAFFACVLHHLLG